MFHAFLPRPIQYALNRGQANNRSGPFVFLFTHRPTSLVFDRFQRFVQILHFYYIYYYPTFLDYSIIPFSITHSSRSLYLID